MSSTAMNFVGEKPSGPQIFSYAQAAKSRPSATSVFVAQMNQSVTPNSIVSTKDMNSIVSTSSQSSVREDQTAIESIETLSKLEISTEMMALDSKIIRSEPSDSPPSTPGLVLASISSPSKENEKEDDYISIESTSGLVREPNSTGKKERRQKSTSDETDKEELKSEVLVPAPLPAVNFWQQRKEKLAKSISPQTTKNMKPLSDAINSVDGLPLDIKTAEPKKRGKQLGIDTSERYTPSNQNGLKRESTIISKTPKKTGNGPNKFKEEQSSKRNGLRGARLTEKDEKSLNNQIPPPVEDASSWPTPETVLIEDKRKFQEKQERDEKDDNTSNKPRQKEKWVPVPYIPTVTFNTPMPTRGGRTRGNGRAGRSEHDTRSNHVQNGTTSTEKSYTVTSDSTNSSSEVDRPSARDSSTTNSAPSLRRQSGDISNSRKLSIAQLAEKTRSNHPKSENQYQNESYQFSRNIQSGQNLVDNRDSKTNNAEQFNSLKLTQIQSNEVAGIGSADRRFDSNIRNSDHSHIGRENNHNSRERVEGRSERSRGGFRGRGSHSNYANGHSHHSNFSNGASGHHQNGYNVRQAPYSPPLVPPYSNQFVHPPRANRVGPRSQSIPSSGTYGRFSQNAGNVSLPLPSLQTSTPMYDYTPIQPMSAPPYQPFIDQVSVFAMVTMQLEYYFSIDNLCKDVYLRKHMDSQGFVYLSFIAGFKRIVALTQDFELIRFACQESEVIELVRGEDGIDRLRRKEGWGKWVLTVEEREDSSKNLSPSFWNPSQYTQKLQHVGQIIMASPHPACVMSYSMSESGFPPYNKDGSIAPCPTKNDVYQPPTPLSAAVPDFAPGLPPIDISNDLLEAENTFHEDEVANLTLVFASPDASNSDVKALTPHYHSSQRTFSNGSLQRRIIKEETNDDSYLGEKSCENGFHQPENPYEIRSRPTSPHSPTRSDLSNGPPVMWVKGQRQQVPISERNSQELYITFRSRALRNREISLLTTTETHPDMKLLYEFWSHFLCRNFNSQMYSEFRRYALEDARTGSLHGMSNLINYYDEALNSKKKVIPEVLARHFLDLVKLETSDERPAFERLRAAWRNGALDLKNRKRINGLLNPRLKEELEQAPYQKPELQ
ncbi:putative la domain containing protein [Erysiphe neolycopersici]|uniref:Putative la domain containing protein n=1 Tax=Erysiphe neolycopersici TaxID=212602 RepID=A0A420HUM6_9PEZI|nr:putative la domain containing protein [Erysiphe neolycopersici]